MQPTKKSGYIQTVQKFGSCQLHVEFLTPLPVQGADQGRGNSGVFLMHYETQVLDSFNNNTYFDGQVGALYGRSAPLVNARREPGTVKKGDKWQSYDIIFHRPIFENKTDKVIRKATFTVLLNGVLIQDHEILHGGTGWKGPHAISDYKYHEDKMPIRLQDHGNPVSFRNIWIRELDE